MARAQVRFQVPVKSERLKDYLAVGLLRATETKPDARRLTLLDGVELGDETVQLATGKITAALSDENAEAGAIPAPLAMHHSVGINESKSRRGKTIELEDGDRFRNGVPGFLEGLRQQVRCATFDETRLTR